MGDDMNALLVIDLQRGMFADPAMQPHDGQAVLKRVTSLIAAARAAGARVIFVQHDGGEGDVLASGTPGFALCPELAPAPGEPIIVKRFCSAFQETGLGALLAERGIKSLTICGMCTEYCVDTTCRAAFENGYTVTLAGDAHTTFDTPAIPAPTIIRHHNTTLRNAGFVTLQDSAAIRFSA